MNVAVDEWFGPGLAPTVSIVGAVPVMLHHGLAGVGSRADPAIPKFTGSCRVLATAATGQRAR